MEEQESLSDHRLKTSVSRLEIEKPRSSDTAYIKSTEPSQQPSADVLGNGDEPISRIVFILLIASVTLVGFIYLLDVSIVSTAIPKITTEFRSLNDVGWYGSAYLLANCALQPLTGKIYTYFDSKWTYLTFLAIFEFGSALCGAAQSSTMLIAGRAVAGIGGSGLLNGAYTIVSAAVPLSKVPVYIGIVMGISQIGMLLGPVVGGVLTEYSTWRWCFYINLPLGGFISIFLFLIHVPNSAKKNAGNQSLLDILRNLDLPGFVLFAPATIQLILALQWGGVYHPWNSATIIGLFCGAFSTYLVFLGWEYHVGEEAMVPFSIIGKRVILCSCMNMGFVLGGLNTATYYLPIYFQSVRDASPTMSGVYILPTLLASVLSLMACSVLVQRLGYYIPFAILGAIVSLIASGVTSLFSPTTPTSQWIGYQVILGIGSGLSIQIPIIAVQNNSSRQVVPITSALLVFCQNLGGTIFLTFSQLAFTTELRRGLHKYANGVDADIVIAAGARAVRNIVQGEDLSGVVMAYSKAFDYTRYVGLGAAAGAFMVAFGMGWKRVEKAKVEEKDEESI
ncbi:putative MFS transporter [Bisporella sp. PMI_857]|nr:putative MFS transporter [Bisporella sp. PMI_857]